MTTSTAFESAWRAPGRDVYRVDVYADGDVIEADIPIGSGSRVGVNGSRPGVLATLTMTTSSSIATDLLGRNIRVKAYRGPRYADGSTEPIGLGVFVPDADTLTYGPEGSLSFTAPDQWVIVQKARFTRPEVTNGECTVEAARIISEAFPEAMRPDVVIAATSTVLTVREVWLRDRDAAALALLKAAGAEAFFDGDGRLIIRDVPRLDAVPAWTVNTGPTGVLIAAQRGRSKTKTYNSVVVTGSDINGTAPFDPVIVDDDDPDSLTYVSEDADRVPVFYSSPLLKTSTQATNAGLALLDTKRQLAYSLDLRIVPNAALQYGQVIEAQLPDGRVERHLIESFDVPLDVTPDQPITTRSNRVDGGDEETPE